MSDPLINQIEYFIGIEGEQKGPFSFGDIQGMISSGEINSKTPIWHSELSGWDCVEGLKEFTSETPEEKIAPKLTSPLSLEIKNGKQISAPNHSLKKRPSKESDPFETVFSGKIDIEKPIENNGFKSWIITGAIMGGLLAAATFYVLTQTPPPQVVSKKTVKVSASQQRGLSLSQAQIKFNKEPESGIPELIAVLKVNSTDNVGLEALETLLSYYRQKQMTSEAGKVLMIAKRPLEALGFFLQEPRDLVGAETAYEEAANMAKGNERKELILKQITLLLGSVVGMEKAINRIKLLDQEFPGTQHPYQYYLKSTEGKIADIFARTAFHYNETLGEFLISNLSQVRLLEKPLLRVTKDKLGKYQISATYKGTVNFHNDRIPNIFFVFLLSNEQWIIVDTNLTKERTAAAKEAQKIHLTNGVTENEMLQGLENLFKTQFPAKGLHEIISSQKTRPSNSDE
ncbi:MAG: DUF4339 domain-containing protein [Deltaproteobacteria bacterium]|nr:DUF4339 domain-containing protein [Deltaproteobacteria bacterium]